MLFIDHCYLISKTLANAKKQFVICLLDFITLFCIYKVSFKSGFYHETFSIYFLYTCSFFTSFTFIHSQNFYDNIYVFLGSNTLEKKNMLLYINKYIMWLNRSYWANKTCRFIFLQYIKNKYYLYFLYFYWSEKFNKFILHVIVLSYPY